ncbi:hypothetical protein BN132_655 [Cronobacter turicensis 564]|nr:hypothetical protein BN132_655 [Cronobacter turicensis 564]
MVGLQQAKPFRVFIRERIKLQALRVIERAAHPLAVAAPHRQAVGVVDLRVNGVAHAAFVIAAAEHTGHRRDAELFDIFAREQEVFHFHDHLARFAVNDELIRAGHARAVQQRVSDKRGVLRFRGFKPESGEIRELFRRIGKRIDRQPAGRQPVLEGAVYRAEIARAEEGDDIATRQLRRFERPKTGEAEIGLPFQLAGIDARVMIVKELRAEMHFAGLAGRRIEREHPHPAAKAHADVEKLHVELAALDVIPQGMSGVILDAVISLRGKLCERIGQRSRRAAPRFLRELGGHSL